MRLPLSAGKKGILPKAQGYVPIRKGLRSNVQDNKRAAGVGQMSTGPHLSPVLELSSWESLDEFLNFSESTFLTLTEIARCQMNGSHHPTLGLVS